MPRHGFHGLRHSRFSACGGGSSEPIKTARSCRQSGCAMFVPVERSPRHNMTTDDLDTNWEHVDRDEASELATTTFVATRHDHNPWPSPQ